jgi:RNA polymerase sigma-70 factor (ECF subfamily)
MSTDQAAADAATFKRQLAETIPHLRAFARSLCGRPDFADDLVQEAMLKAWGARERFEPGTNLRAWTFTILRNCYLTEMRRNKFVGDYDEGVAERTLQAPMGQEDPLHLADMRRALMALPRERREAILLVGAGGFSYEEAAEICQTAVGTMKSRVGRARAALNEMLEGGNMPPREGVQKISAHESLINDLALAASGSRR